MIIHNDKLCIILGLTGEAFEQKHSIPELADITTNHHYPCPETNMSNTVT